MNNLQHWKPIILAILIGSIIVGCTSTGNETPPLLILGGTIIDVNERGESDDDRSNTFILIQGDTISSIGDLNSNPDLPDNAIFIDASGKFILPGLIDGFAVLNNQQYANAFLYMGITTIIGVDGGRRGPFFPDAKPSPDFYRLESVGDDKKPIADHLSDLDDLFNRGYAIALLKYALTPEQVKELKVRAGELGMGCIGEFGHTSYTEAANLGIEVFVHTTRYSLDVAPEEMAKAVANEPFSDDLESPKWNYYKYLSTLDMGDQMWNDHGNMLGRSGTFLMPTLSLLYLDQPESKNPWNYTISEILSETDINNPANRETGKHHYGTNIQEHYSALAIRELEVEKLYASKGARYLAGSATDVWGTMPGISLHTELHLLSTIGLSNREVLASATSNFNEAFGWKTGIIKEGYRANLLILQNNPVEDLDYLLDIDQLILAGISIDRDSLAVKKTDQQK